jgi:hypothetical protein
VLHATLTNYTSKPIRHIGVLVHAAGKNGAGDSSIEYEFEVHLAPFQTRDVIGREYRDSDEAALSCEEAAAPMKPCRGLKARGYKVLLPAAMRSIARLPVSEVAHFGPIDECWAKFVIYSDGSAWSVSPL